MKNKSIKYKDLMKHRVHEILLISSPYDSFILEEDGSLTDQILSEYLGMNLSYAPRVWRASTAHQANKMLGQRFFDLVIMMLRIPDMAALKLGQRIKGKYPKIPVILLAFDQSEIEQLPKDTSESFDNIFLWSGNSNVFPAIIKHIEDKKNIRRDIKNGDVRAILLVEDNPRYYSLIFPVIYREIIFHTRNLLSSTLSDDERLLYMRSRPKLLLAKNYEEALKYFKKYKSNLLGVITDLRFPKNGVIDESAGLKLTNAIKRAEHSIPVLIQSYEKYLKGLKTNANEVLDKSSSLFLKNLQNFIKSNFGFGDFKFQMPDGKKLNQISNIHELIHIIKEVPDESIEYHAKLNHFSNWLAVRGELDLASKFRSNSHKIFKNANQRRKSYIKILSTTPSQKRDRPIVAFKRRSHSHTEEFMMAGKGSLGGKARGLAFAYSRMVDAELQKSFPEIHIGVPKTMVIGTDYFDDFMESNGLWETAVGNNDNSRIEKKFLKAKLPKELIEILKSFLIDSSAPLAIRSSSLLEDSQYQPLAGMYATYMIPNCAKSVKERLNQISEAIRRVYASTFFQDPKSLMDNIIQRIEEEKMAVIIMEIAGKDHSGLFYPTVSGVAQSYNYYPVSYMKRNEGISFLALGLGRTIADGEKSLRVSPKYPNILPQYYSISSTIENSQNEFYALNLSDGENPMMGGVEDNIKRYPLEIAESDGELKWTASVVSSDNNVIRDSLKDAGPRVMTFAPLLKWGKFPLCDLLNELLNVGELSLGCPIEIEFAINLHEDKPHEFYLLQIKPMIIRGLEVKENIINKRSIEDIICKSGLVLGDGRIDEIRDVIYVDPKLFRASDTRNITKDIEKLNKKTKGRPYLLMGPGRWGSADPWLGIPVSWDQISGARAIVEYSHEDMEPDPSFGSHFFQNITSLHIGYFTISRKKESDLIEWDWFESIKSEKVSGAVKWIQLNQPIQININTKNGTGQIFKPKPIEEETMDEEMSTGI